MNCFPISTLSLASTQETKGKVIAINGKSLLLFPDLY